MTTISFKDLSIDDLEFSNPEKLGNSYICNLYHDDSLVYIQTPILKINEIKFDPQIYKYGGAFIYPLGIYYYSLIKLNLIENIEADSIVRNENLIDKIYFHGRFFVLLSFIFSAFFLYKSLNLITTKDYSLIFTMIYLFSPSSIMYSQIIKPNWYALLWFNLSIFFGLKYLLKEQKKYFLILVSIFLGLAIGSSILFIPSLFFIFFFLFSSFFLTALNIDLKSSMGVAASALGNIGPALGQFGPTNNYALMPDVGKWLLTFCMLLGRLEIFTVVVLFSRTFRR